MEPVCRLRLQFFSSSVQYSAMGVALYRWGVMAQSNSSSDSSLGEESLRRTSAGAEFQSLTVRGKKENL